MVHVYLQTTIFPVVNINLEQIETLVSICVTSDIKWTIPGSR
jgi:hypothetical protein